MALTALGRSDFVHGKLSEKQNGSLLVVTHCWQGTLIVF